MGPAGSYQVGQGAMVTGSQRIFNQGAPEQGFTDLAVAGPGGFVTKGSVAGVGPFYTRNGSHLDKRGSLLLPEGLAGVPGMWVEN